MVVYLEGEKKETNQTRKTKQNKNKEKKTQNINNNNNNLFRKEMCKESSSVLLGHVL